MLAALALAGPCLSAQAVLPDGAVLEFDPGVVIYDSYGNVAGVTGGSYFGVDTNNNGKFTAYEKIPISITTVSSSAPASPPAVVIPV